MNSKTSLSIYLIWYQSQTLASTCHLAAAATNFTVGEPMVTSGDFHIVNQAVPCHPRARPSSSLLFTSSSAHLHRHQCRIRSIRTGSNSIRRRPRSTLNQAPSATGLDLGRRRPRIRAGSSTLCHRWPRSRSSLALDCLALLRTTAAELHHPYSALLYFGSRPLSPAAPAL